MMMHQWLTIIPPHSITVLWRGQKLFHFTLMGSPLISIRCTILIFRCATELPACFRKTERNMRIVRLTAPIISGLGMYAAGPLRPGALPGAGTGKVQRIISTFLKRRNNKGRNRERFIRAALRAGTVCGKEVYQCPTQHYTENFARIILTTSEGRRPL